MHIYKGESRDTSYQMQKFTHVERITCLALSIISKRIYLYYILIRVAPGQLK